MLKHYHLLDVLYHLMVPIMCEESEGENSYQWQHKSKEIKQGCFSMDETSHSTKVFKDLWQLISKLLAKVKNGPLKLVKLVEVMISSLSPQVGSLGKNPQNVASNNDKDDKKIAPQVEEIMIPSVTLLVMMGVKFHATKGDISTIKFDTKTNKFYLPIVKLDVNSEVILRNLVAYEALAISSPLVLARYTELMNGIVDTAEDARILAEEGIIESELGYQDVADLWNGMSKSVRLTYVDFIDKAIKDVNDYFDSTKKVRFYKVVKAYVYGSWRMLVILVTILVIGLMCLQSFCTVYDCPRTFKFEPKN